MRLHITLCKLLLDYLLRVLVDAGLVDELLFLLLYDLLELVVSLLFVLDLVGHELLMRPGLSHALGSHHGLLQLLFITLLLLL